MTVSDHPHEAAPGEDPPAAAFAPPDGLPPAFAPSVGQPPAFPPPVGQPPALVPSVGQPPVFPPPVGQPVAFPPPVGQPAPFPPPAGPPPAVGQRSARSTGRGRLLLILLLVAGLAGVGGGATGLFVELTRPATRAEIGAAGQAEVASRWQRLAAGRIFPPVVTYTTSDGATASMTRVGIAPGISCAAGLDARVLPLFRRYGCQGVLRATYLDQSGTIAGTVGVAVLRSPAAAQAVAGAMPQQGGVRVPVFSGTRAAPFGNGQRQFISASTLGPYVFLFAGGPTDGRPLGDLPGGSISDAGFGIVQRVTAVLTGGARPCARKDIRC